jgi:hypothetical protein
LEYHVPKPNSELAVKITARKIEKPMDQSTKTERDICTPQAAPMSMGIKPITTSRRVSYTVMLDPREGFFFFLRH